MYKSDWMTFGGFDVKKYTNKWGGEDWDILDKLVGAECAGGVPTNTMSSCAGRYQKGLRCSEYGTRV